MEALIAQVPFYIKGISLVLTALVIFATTVARLTSSKKDDAVVGKVGSFIAKIIKFLPTIGVNPETKKMSEALDELKAKEEVASKSEGKEVEEEKV